MTDMQRFTDVLDNQQERGVQAGDYGRVSYTILTDERGFLVSIESNHVAFRFDTNERFVGIANWKE
jgi:hypothetical protein